MKETGLNDLYEFCLIKKQWTQLITHQQLESEGKNKRVIKPGERYGHSLNYYLNYLVVFGGFKYKYNSDASMGFVNELFLFDLCC